jgi:hypothetical protein
LQDQRIGDLAPHLLSAVSAHRRKQNTVAAALHNGTWIFDIVGALTVPAIMQYLMVHQCIQHIVIFPDVLDKFVWRWWRTVSTPVALGILPSSMASSPSWVLSCSGKSRRLTSVISSFGWCSWEDAGLQSTVFAMGCAPVTVCAVHTEPTASRPPTTSMPLVT